MKEIEEIALDKIPTTDDREFLELRGCIERYKYIKLFCENDELKDKLGKQLDSKGWKWDDGRPIGDVTLHASFVTLHANFCYCISIDGVSFSSYNDNKLHGNVVHVVNVIESAGSRTTRNNGDNCPSCGTRGEWVGLMIKCPNCWKTW